MSKEEGESGLCPFSHSKHYVNSWGGEKKKRIRERKKEERIEFSLEPWLHDSAEVKKEGGGGKKKKNGERGGEEPKSV